MSKTVDEEKYSLGGSPDDLSTSVPKDSPSETSTSAKRELAKSSMFSGKASFMAPDETETSFQRHHQEDLERESPSESPRLPGGGVVRFTRTPLAKSAQGTFNVPTEIEFKQLVASEGPDLLKKL